MNHLVLSLFLFSTLVSATQANTPSWTKENTVQKIGNDKVLVICEGIGLSRDLAYRNAVQNCMAIAANEKNSHFTTKQVVVENRESTSFYSEIVSNKQVSGLKGDTVHEYSTKTEAGNSVILQMKFDLSKTNVVKAESAEDLIDRRANTNQLIEVSPIKTTDIANKESVLIQGDARTWVTTTLPKCLEILIRGEQSRTLKCTSNPMSMSINSVTDKEVIFIAPKGYLPKTLKIKNGRLPSSYETNSIEVYFDAN